MNSINLGYIQELMEKEKKKYKVFLFDGEDQVIFSKIKDAIKYFKYHAIAIFNYEKIVSLHIQYFHLNDTIHYLVFKKNKENEIIVFEATKFDFLRTHPHKFSKYRLRRMINEKNYSFSDVLRASINWHPFYSIWISILSIFIIICSGIFLIYGLDFLNKKSSNLTVLDNAILFTSFFLSILAVFIVGIFQQKTRFTLFQTSGDFKEIDWRKWYIIRMSHLAISIFVFVISFAIISFFIHKSLQNEDRDFTTILFINISIWIIYFISSFSMTIYSFQMKYKTLKKHFNKNEIKMSKKWFRNQDEKELFKNDNIFLFNNSFSNQMTRQAIDETIEIMVGMQKEELREMRKKELSIRSWIINSYSKYLKGVNNDNISKNNK